MENKKFLVGWSRCDLTPDRPVFIMGQFYERLSTHVRDPITATACAIEGDGGEVLLLSADLAMISDELLRDVRNAVSKKNPKIDTNSIILSTIHTHSAPGYTPPVENMKSESGSMLSPANTKLSKREENILTGEEFYVILVEKFSNIIVEAHADKKPAGLSTQMEYCTVGFNRIMMYKDKSARMYGNCETADFEGTLGASDPGVEMIFVFNADETLGGIIIEVACPSQVTEHQYFVSADYWSETRRLVRERFGDIEILPLCGTAGDMSPRDMVRLKRDSSFRSGESPLNSHMPKADITRPGWEMYDERGIIIIGKRLYRAVCDGYEKAKDNICENNILHHECRILRLPLLRVSLEEYLVSYKQCVEILEKNGLDPNEPWYNEKTPSLIKEELYVPFGIVNRYEAQQTTDLFPVEVHLFRIGNTAFYTTPFEPYVEYGFRIRARVRYDHLVSVQLACGAIGYLPTRRAVDGKPYSAIAASNSVGPDGGTLMATLIADTLNSFL